MAEIKDISWQIVQEKAFTSWMNQTLAQRNYKVKDIRKDLSDGVVLANFFEILGDKKIQTRIEYKPTNKIQKIQNLHIALKFLETDVGIKNPGCSAEDIVDAETHGIKLVLGLLWMLYKNFRIAVIKVQDKSSEEGLLLWCKHVTDGYSGVNIESFKNSFKDGLAFLAMVHRFNPEKTKVDYGSFAKDNPAHNLTVAFDLAEQELGIPKLLDVKEVIEGRVDERSLILYTSLYFHAFKAAQVAQDLEHAKQSTEETLAAEKRKNEELRKQNEQLLKELHDLRVQFEELHKKNLSLLKALEEERTETTLKLEDHTKKTLILTEQLAEENSLRHRLESQVRDLTSNLSANQDSSAGILAQKHKLEEELHELKKKLESEIAARKQLEEEYNKRKEDDEKQLNELRKKQALYEEEIENLKNDVENFKAQLDNERKENKEQHRVLQERADQDSIHRKGLQVLRRNLDIHIEDLHQWQKYLDTKETFLDFDREVRPLLDGELDGKVDFVEELNLLSGKLEGENEAILKLLKGKKAELKAEELSKAKK